MSIPQVGIAGIPRSDQIDWKNRWAHSGLGPRCTGIQASGADRSSVESSGVVEKTFHPESKGNSIGSKLGKGERKSGTCKPAGSRGIGAAKIGESVLPRILGAERGHHDGEGRPCAAGRRSLKQSGF